MNVLALRYLMKKGNSLVHLTALLAPKITVNQPISTGWLCNISHQYFSEVVGQLLCEIGSASHTYYNNGSFSILQVGKNGFVSQHFDSSFVQAEFFGLFCRCGFCHGLQFRLRYKLFQYKAIILISYRLMVPYCVTRAPDKPCILKKASVVCSPQLF